MAYASTLTSPPTIVGDMTLLSSDKAEMELIDPDSEGLRGTPRYEEDLLLLYLILQLFGIL